MNKRLMRLEKLLFLAQEASRNVLEVVPANIYSHLPHLLHLQNIEKGMVVMFERVNSGFANK